MFAFFIWMTRFGCLLMLYIAMVNVLTECVSNLVRCRKLGGGVLSVIDAQTSFLEKFLNDEVHIAVPLVDDSLIVF
jgi:hypothetical protein